MSNSAYFSLVGARRGNAIGIGSALGVTAGLGAVYLPPWLCLDARLTRRTTAAGALTVAVYTAGGVAAGLSCHALSS